MAMTCSTVLLEQPRAASTTSALRKLAGVMNRRAPQPFSATSTAAAPLCRARIRRAEKGAGMVASPGRERPSASATQLIELAVNSPAHEPQVGQTDSSSSHRSSSVMSPLKYLPRPSKIWLRLTLAPL